MNAQQIQKALRHSDALLQNSRQITHLLQRGANAGETNDSIDEQLKGLNELISEDYLGLVDLLPTRKLQLRKASTSPEFIFTHGTYHTELLKLFPTGEILVRGKSPTADSDIVEALREFARSSLAGVQSEPLPAIKAEPISDLPINPIPEIGIAKIESEQVVLAGVVTASPYHLPENLDTMKQSDLLDLAEKLKADGRAIVQFSRSDSKKELAAKIRAAVEPLKVIRTRDDMPPQPERFNA